MYQWVYVGTGCGPGSGVDSETFGQNRLRYKRLLKSRNRLWLPGVGHITACSQAVGTGSGTGSGTGCGQAFDRLRSNSRDRLWSTCRPLGRWSSRSCIVHVHFNVRLVKIKAKAHTRGFRSSAERLNASGQPVERKRSTATRSRAGTGSNRLCGLPNRLQTGW